MKKTRKIAAMIAAMALTAAMCVPTAMMSASAADYTITFDQTAGTNTTTNYDGDTATHTYEAYQVFSGDLTESSGKKVLSNINWGEGVTISNSNVNEFVTALKTADSTSFTTVDGTKSAKEVANDIAVILKAQSDDAAALQAFAKVVSGYLSSNKVSGAAGATTLVISDSKPGYYLIQDTSDSPATPTPGTGSATTTTYALKTSGDLFSIATALATVTSSGITAESTEAVVAEYINTNWSNENVQNAIKSVPGYSAAAAATDVITVSTSTSTTTNNGAKTRYILTVTDNVTVKVKADAPTVVKKVKENEKKATDDFKVNGLTGDAASTGYNDVADYNIGDAVPFKLYGTLPDASTYADYSAYFYQFTDTLATQFNQPATVTIKAGTATLVYKLASGGYSLDSTNSTNVNASASGDVTVTYASGVLTVTFDNIKDYIATSTGNELVTVEYEAVLNSTANPGLNGQENTVHLTYSNNPNVTWTPTKDGTPDSPSDKEDTPEDKVIVFTYELDINKVDDQTTPAKLAGAQFVVKAVDGVNAGKYVIVDANNKVSSWMTTKPTAVATSVTADTAKLSGVYISQESGVISIIGLDDGTYEVEEIKEPDGYNKLTASLTWEIVASTANNQTWNGTASAALTDIDLKESNSSIDQKNDTTTYGVVEGKIENKSGSTLPSTGGMGTTLFILGGGVTAAAAGIYLVSKKRAKKEDAQ